MVKGSLIAALKRAEERLPDLLKDASGWNTLDVDYEPPHVERLWQQFEDGFRVCLHRIHPCEQALFHPHPWPSAVKILSGLYEMGIGYGVGKKDPAEAATLILSTGSSYEMIEPDGWHYVRPLGAPSLSVMVMGPPYGLRHLGEKGPETKLGPLGDTVKLQIIDEFSRFYRK